MKTCMVIGKIKIEKTEMSRIKMEFRREILQAVEDGYTIFITALNGHTDYCFAEIVLELKEKYPIKLEAELPYKERINAKSRRFQAILMRCDAVGVHSDEYTGCCHKKCNRFMLQRAERVIALYGEELSRSVTSLLIYARILERELILIK